MLSSIRKGLLASVVGIGLLAGNSYAVAAVPTMRYSGLVIFGDSISDTGNVLSLTKTFGQPEYPNFPGAAGFFSNGPAWTTYLVKGLNTAGSTVNANADPSNLLFDGTKVIQIGAQGGQNFAYGGARTGLGGSAGATTGLLGQLVAWDNSTSILAPGGSLTRSADPNALYVVMAGANDLRDYRSREAGAVDPAKVAGKVVGTLNLLANAGARHFLISTLPDLGLTPEAVGLGLVAQSTAVTLGFNGALTSMAGSFEAVFNQAHNVDLDIRTLDFYGLFNRVVDDATHNGGGIFGITNVTTPCILPGAPGAYFVTGSTGPGCKIAAFSDPLHPSSAAHVLLGDLAVQTALAPVPEPSEYAMLIAGLLVVVGLRRRAQAVA